MRIETSVKSESYRIARTLSDTFSGFYISNKFLILPYNKVDLTKLTANSVLLPEEVTDITELEISSIKFPEKVSFRYSSSSLNNYLAKCEKLVTDGDYLSKIPRFNEKDSALIERTLINLCREVTAILPDFKPDLDKLTIHPTLFGTKGSFFRASNSEIKIYIRCNSGKLEMERIFFLLLAIFTRPKLRETYQAQWNDAQLVEEWFINETIIAEILRKYRLKPELISLNKSIRQGIHSEYEELSKQFIQQLGLDDSQKKWSLNENFIYYGQQKVKELTWEESNILKNMISEVYKVFTYDEISRFMLFDDGKYSLYAISKRIERLRKKLQSQGISPFLIKNVRGEGFYLQNAV